MPIIKMFSGPWDGYTNELYLDPGTPILASHYFTLPVRENDETVPTMIRSNEPVPYEVYRFIGMHITGTTELHYLYVGRMNLRLDYEKEEKTYTVFDEESNHEGKDLYATKEELEEFSDKEIDNIIDSIVEEIEGIIEEDSKEEGDEDKYAE